MCDKTFSLVLVILRAISLISAVKVLWGVQINQISVLFYRCHKLGLWVWLYFSWWRIEICLWAVLALEMDECKHSWCWLRWGFWLQPRCHLFTCSVWDIDLCAAVETLDQDPPCSGVEEQPVLTQIPPDFTKARWAWEHPEALPVFWCWQAQGRRQSKWKGQL